MDQIVRTGGHAVRHRVVGGRAAGAVAAGGGHVGGHPEGRRTAADLGGIGGDCRRQEVVIRPVIGAVAVVGTVIGIPVRAVAAGIHRRVGDAEHHPALAHRPAEGGQDLAAGDSGGAGDIARFTGADGATGVAGRVRVQVRRIGRVAGSDHGTGLGAVGRAHEDDIAVRVGGQRVADRLALAEGGGGGAHPRRGGGGFGHGGRAAVDCQGRAHQEAAELFAERGQPAPRRGGGGRGERCRAVGEGGGDPQLPDLHPGVADGPHLLHRHRLVELLADCRRLTAGRLHRGPAAAVRGQQELAGAGVGGVAAGDHAAAAHRHVVEQVVLSAHAGDEHAARAEFLVRPPRTGETEQGGVPLARPAHRAGQIEAAVTVLGQPVALADRVRQVRHGHAAFAEGRVDHAVRGQADEHQRTLPFQFVGAGHHQGAIPPFEQPLGGRVRAHADQADALLAVAAVEHAVAEIAGRGQHPAGGSLHPAGHGDHVVPVDLHGGDLLVAAAHRGDDHPLLAETPVEAAVGQVAHQGEIAVRAVVTVAGGDDAAVGEQTEGEDFVVTDGGRGDRRAVVAEGGVEAAVPVETEQGHVARRAPGGGTGDEDLAVRLDEHRVGAVAHPEFHRHPAVEPEGSVQPGDRPGRQDSDKREHQPDGERQQPLGAHGHTSGNGCVVPKKCCQSIPHAGLLLQTLLRPTFPAPHRRPRTAFA